MSKIDASPKGGRPRKKDYELRTISHRVCFSPAEEVLLAANAAKAGQTVKQFLHNAPLTKRIRARINDEQIDMTRNLARMGSNLNQLAHNANLGGFSAIKDTCKVAAERVIEIAKRFLDIKPEEEPDQEDESDNNVKHQNSQQT